MKRRRDLKTWSKRNIPDDLWLEILTRVPVKSALRFRCVAKSWKSMIDDPRFGRMHLTRYNNNRLESRLFVVQGYRSVEWVVRCSKTLRASDRRLVRFPAGDATYSIISSIDGLFLLSGPIPWSSPELVLWNPSIGNTRRLPPLPIIYPNRMRYFDFGLGFDPLSQDYKYVTVVLGRKARTCIEFIAIYTVGTGTWKTVWFQDEELRNRFTFAYPHKPFCLRGVLYCLAIDETVGHFKLVSFDLKYELFAYGSLPNEGVILESHYVNYYRSQALTLIDGGNSLALVDMSMPKGSIWVTDCIGDDMNSFTWTLRHTFPTVFPKYNAVAVLFLYLRKVDEDEMLLKAHNVVLSFNLKTHTLKVVLNKCLWVDKIWPHMESMILHKG